MQKLANKKKPLTDTKWTDLIEHRLGMDFHYNWDPVNREFRTYYRTDYALSDNTIILFFKNNRISLRLGNSEFEGDDPMFPPTLLKDAIQIRYRCTLTNQIRHGSKIIQTSLPIESFQIPSETDYVSLLALLREQ